jgi:DNA-binding beta-propeller fold protein YncE
MLVASPGRAAALPARSAKPTIAYVLDVHKDGLMKLNMSTGTFGFLSLGFTPGTIAITPDGKTAYVGSGTNVYPVTLPSGPVGAPLSVGGVVNAIAITPNGRTVYAVQTGGLTPSRSLRTWSARQSR